MIEGKVWLVGAGPGDVGLLTIKGKRVLEEADVVVYDSLVGDGILAIIPKTAEAINVGKRSGNHTMPQNEISQLLADKAKQGYQVVRLKGGDPFLFGRGGEELEVLNQYGISYEVVPGVTSALAVPAYNGIPVTHRDYCSSVHIITGHKKVGASYDIDFEALVKTKGTLIFLMGIAALDDICSSLLNAGMDGDMPAAVLQKGTTARQKRIVATISTLPDEVKRIGIETPAIIVVGNVCQLAEQLSWAESLPLFGKKILVTRPKALISSMAQKLRVMGAEVLELPAIATSVVEDRSALHEAMEYLESYQWIAFTSPTGVTVFFEELNHYGKDIRSLGNIKVAALGSGTKRALREYGIFADLMPDVYDGAALGALMAETCEKNARILLPRASIGNHEIISELQKREDLQIDDVASYDTSYESWDVIDERELFEKGDIDCAVFTSASTVKGFVEACKGLDFYKVTAACIGKQTKAAADSYGMKTYMAKKATIDSLLELVTEICGGLGKREC